MKDDDTPEWLLNAEKILGIRDLSPSLTQSVKHVVKGEATRKPLSRVHFSSQYVRRMELTAMWHRAKK